MRKIILKILLSLVLLSILIVVILLYRTPNSTKEKKNIEIIVIDAKEQVLIQDTFEVYETSLLQILESNYDIRYENTSFGVTLYDIESIKTDFIHSYIAIYVNGKYSNVGISSILLENNMRIELKELNL